MNTSGSDHPPTQQGSNNEAGRGDLNSIGDTASAGSATSRNVASMQSEHQVASQLHIPVLKEEVLKILDPQKGETVLDVTLGLGGHAASLLEAVGPTGSLIGLDADKENLDRARERLATFKDQIDLRHANFGMIASLDLPPVDIVFADLGLSSPHVDEPERGFTFREEAPLDLRFDRTSGVTAAELIAQVPEQELKAVLRDYGEVRLSGKLAAALKESGVQTTFDVKKCVEEVCGYRAPSVLPQIFQALRIAVNDELTALGALLLEGPKLLREGGRMAVISYHSLEDRPVKHAFRALTTPEKDDVTGQDISPAPFELITKKPVRPSDEEVAANPRSRSALLRCIQRRTL